MIKAQRRKVHNKSGERLMNEFGKCVFVEANDDLIAFAKDWTAKQVRFGNDHFNQFVFWRKLFGELAFFVNGVTSIEERRYRIVTENGFNLFGGQWLFGVIPLDQRTCGFVAQQFA